MGELNTKLLESFERIGTEEHRSYYIPFFKGDVPTKVHGIWDRASSSRFLSLDGIWQIKEHAHVEDFVLDEALEGEIPVPACVQMHGFDHIQYINARYPFPVLFPKVGYDNPTYHYRRSFFLRKVEGERYYMNFEGVDSAFYLYINGQFKGYSQISHATSEFDITELVQDGENVVDVAVIKWCVSSYLECQDKFRFTGIFRSVYVLSRPEVHITDYQLKTELSGEKGIFTLYNNSPVAITATLDGKTVEAKAGECASVTIDGVEAWSAESPVLYPVVIEGGEETIYEQVGFRTVSIDGKVFKINGEAVKLRGVNRHDFHPDRGATVFLDDIAKDLALMKELNVNAVRTSHYPNCPEFYLLCEVFGIYAMDEADVEMHGADCRKSSTDMVMARDYAEDLFVGEGILDRHTALVERDKNRTSVIIWSLGNESSFGQGFYAGAEYIRSHDLSHRPVHYEGVRWSAKEYYFTPLIDVVSIMYPSLEQIHELFIDNPDEYRPFVMCEYTHAMGNSSGDIADYWKLIYNEPQMMGAFVWEWADHGIRTERGFLYGGDFGEAQHDGNFCCDGLLTPDRKFKSAALEMQAVYGGKLTSPMRDVAIPEQKGTAKSVCFGVDLHTGELASILADGKEVLKVPMHFNFSRYIDNDRNMQTLYYDSYYFRLVKPHAFVCEKTENGYHFEGALAAPSLEPMVTYTIDYALAESELTMKVSYRVADWVKHLPRFGFEFGVAKEHGKFSYVGYGPTESYVDKHVSTEYGYYESTADENYDHGYVRPQESGSHYATKYLSINDLFSVTADAPFSQSVNPYTTRQLIDAKHDFELCENDFVNVCIDLGMRGVGSHSCGPQLREEYEIAREGENTFRFVF